MYEEQFAKRLYELRTARNISARDMSYSMNLNPNYINMIESGKSLPSLSGFFNICKFFNITPQDFFNYEVKDTAKYNQLIEELKNISDTNLNSIEDLVHSLPKSF